MIILLVLVNAWHNRVLGLSRMASSRIVATYASSLPTTTLIGKPNILYSNYVRNPHIASRRAYLDLFKESSMSNSFHLYSTRGDQFDSFDPSTSSIKDDDASGPNDDSEKPYLGPSQLEHGHLYFVSIPIGNIKDITLRGIEVLQQADFICAEDTRNTISLLRHLNIKERKRLIAHHEHNYHEQIPYIIKLLKEGNRIAVVSDAGTPCISDPGYQLAAACAKEGIPQHPVPGASAVLSALTISGFDSSEFTFMGFLPVKGKERKAKIDRICVNSGDGSSTVVFYEAPHRIRETLVELVDNGQGLRPCVLCREMTKKYEEIVRGTVESSLQWLDNTFLNAEQDSKTNKKRLSEVLQKSRVRGEFTVVLGPPEKLLGVSAIESVDESIREKLAALQRDGVARSEAVKLVAAVVNKHKSGVYKIALEMDW